MEDKYSCEDIRLGGSATTTLFPTFEALVSPAEITSTIPCDRKDVMNLLLL
jgi:hypothetical protein